MSTTWDHILTDLATRVELAEQALDDGVDLDPKLLQTWTPPENLGPLPEHLRERATSVLAQQVELEQRMQTAMDQLGREIAKANHDTRKLSPFGETVVPKYFDRAV